MPVLRDGSYRSPDHYGRTRRAYDTPHRLSKLSAKIGSLRQHTNKRQRQHRRNTKMGAHVPIGTNRVTLYGNLVADPEDIANGKGVMFRVGHNTYAGKDKDPRSNFTTVKVWGGQAGPVRTYLHKGDPVIIDGKLEQERWETSDGEKRSQHVVIADNVQFLRGGEQQ